MPETQEAADGALMRRFAIFTDFDGTLVELAETPDAIVVPEELRQELAEAAGYLGGAFAIISGRDLSDLELYLPDGIAAAGGHGTQRRKADGARIDAAAALAETANAIAKRLEDFVARNPGLLLELKGSAVALHYRRAPALAEQCREAMAKALESAPDFEALEGKMVIEARPAFTGKADAIRAFMQEEPFAGRVPIFLGDDATDEDGFRAAQEMGGVGIKIGDGKTAARMRAPDVANARALIVGLARRAAERDLEEA